MPNPNRGAVGFQSNEFEQKYELHPDDIEQIKQDALIFDDIEARIKAWPDTQFTIYEKWEDIDGETKVTRYGKIKPIIDENNYPLFEGLFNLSSDIINKRR